MKKEKESVPPKSCEQSACDSVYHSVCVCVCVCALSIVHLFAGMLLLACSVVVIGLITYYTDLCGNEVAQSIEPLHVRLEIGGLLQVSVERLCVCGGGVGVGREREGKILDELKTRHNTKMCGQ